MKGLLAALLLLPLAAAPGALKCPSDAARQTGVSAKPKFTFKDVAADYYFGDGLGVNCMLSLDDQGTLSLDCLRVGTKFQPRAPGHGMEWYRVIQIKEHSAVIERWTNDLPALKTGEVLEPVDL